MTSARLGILSDLHRTTFAGEHGDWHNEYDFAGHRARVERALAWFEQEAVDGLVLCGDLTHHGNVEAMRAVLAECCAALDVPVLAVAGNHDVAQGEDVLADAIAGLADERLTAATPEGRVVAGIRVAGVQPAMASGYARSQLRELPAVQEWGDEPVVLVSHLPLLSRASAVAAHGAPYPGDLVDRERAVASLRTRRGATVVVSGHIHVRDVHFEGAVLQLLQAAMIEPPFEATVLDVRGDVDGRVAVTRRTHRTAEHRAAWEPTLADPVGSWRFVDGGWVVDAALSDAESLVVAR